MSFTSKDINLDNFLKKFTPTFLNEQGKTTIDNAIFMQVAAQLKLADITEKLRRPKR